MSKVWWHLCLDLISFGEFVVLSLLGLCIGLRRVALVGAI